MPCANISLSTSPNFYSQLRHFVLFLQIRVVLGAYGFRGYVKALPALSPNEIKTILKRNFYWASTIKTPFLTGVQVEMLIRELKKKHI